MFERFVRLGVPTVQLDAQGRARPEIAALYSWRYSLLGDMPHVTPGGATVAPGYARPNAGFAHNMQFVDVEDFQGRGESTPTAHYYQVRYPGTAFLKTPHITHSFIDRPPHSCTYLLCRILARRSMPLHATLTCVCAGTRRIASQYSPLMLVKRRCCETCSVTGACRTQP